MRTNKLLILDLEATCWDDKSREYSNSNSEIIEIGVTLYSTINREILESRSYLVNPEKSEVSKFCTELTTITPEMLEGKPNLESTLNLIRRDYKIKNLTWGSWGFYDLNQLRKETKRKGIVNPFGERNFINIKTMVALNHGWSKGKGIGNTLKSLNMEFEGTAHRAIDDTINIARILING